jgi:hypothetical protein
MEWTVIFVLLSAAFLAPVAVFVFCAVAPHYSAGKPILEDQMVACVNAVMDAAVAQRLPRVAICGLGSGLFGWPQPEAARLIVHGLREWNAAHPGPATPTVVLYDSLQPMASAFRAALLDAEAGKGTGPAPALPSAPPAPPQMFSHQWMYQGGGPGIIEAGVWVPYDYDQNRQLEQAWARDPRSKVELVGDACGVKYVECTAVLVTKEISCLVCPMLAFCVKHVCMYAHCGQADPVALRFGIPSLCTSCLVLPLRLGRNGFRYIVDFARGFQRNVTVGSQRAVQRVPLAPGVHPPKYAEAVVTYEEQLAAHRAVIAAAPKPTALATVRAVHGAFAGAYAGAATAAAPVRAGAGASVGASAGTSNDAGAGRGVYVARCVCSATGSGDCLCVRCMCCFCLLAVSLPAVFCVPLYVRINACAASTRTCFRRQWVRWRSGWMGSGGYGLLPTAFSFRPLLSRSTCTAILAFFHPNVLSFPPCLHPTVLHTVLPCVCLYCAHWLLR